MIACIGRCSLIWDVRNLDVDGNWRDGPLLPVEFARQSSNRRITLVLSTLEANLESIPPLLILPSCRDNLRSCVIFRIHRSEYERPRISG
jgi:hypothetical protein